MKGFSDFYLINQGKVLESLNDLNNFDNIYVNIRLRGGKGGFGSLLKSQAVNIKATNVDASRDLDGRRIRNAKSAKQLEEFYRKQKIEEQKIKKQEEISKLNEPVFKEDRSYYKVEKEFVENNNKLVENLNKSILKGLLKNQTQNTIKEKVNFDDFLKQNLIQNNQIEQKQDLQTGEIEIQKKVKLEKNNNENNLEYDKSEQIESIDMNSVNSLEDLIAFGAEKLKQQLIRLGLKSGGSLMEIAQRLMDVKLDPSNLLKSKYLAKIK